MYLNEKQFEQVAEYLDQKLGREASESEILSYIEELESKQYDSIESELKGN